MSITLSGTVHGKTIEFDRELGIADGQQVEVQVTIATANKTWGEGIKRSAGALADDPDWDGIMNEIHEARKLPRQSASDQA